MVDRPLERSEKNVEQHSLETAMKLPLESASHLPRLFVRWDIRACTDFNLLGARGATQLNGTKKGREAQLGG